MDKPETRNTKLETRSKSQIPKTKTQINTKYFTNINNSYRRKSMRKANIFMVLVSVIVMASLILSACSSSPTTTAAPPKTATPTTAAAATTAAPLPVTTVAPTTPAAPKVFNLKFSYHTPPTASLVGAYFKP